MHAEFIEHPSAAQSAELLQRFQEFVQQRLQLPDESADRPLLINLRDEAGELIAGILANAYWDGLEIDTLWVAEQHRGRGLGADLLQRAEAHGRHQGALVAYLKTVEARAFYEKQGYALFGILEDRPRGTLLHHMKKRLD
jgi:GNAT superfamily N-acetyltransferase